MASIDTFIQQRADDLLQTLETEIGGVLPHRVMCRERIVLALTDAAVAQAENIEQQFTDAMKGQKPNG
jgi:hypothetical protein